jgi:hypothetical protein
MQHTCVLRTVPSTQSGVPLIARCLAFAPGHNSRRTSLGVIFRPCCCMATGIPAQQPLNRHCNCSMPACALQVTANVRTRR